MTKSDKYFAIRLRLDRSEALAIWVSCDSERDHLVLSKSDQIALFHSAESLKAFAKAGGFTIEEEEVPSFDFDALLEWTEDPRPDGIQCEEFLNAWNMLGDVGNTIGAKLREPDGADRVYEKLFYGNNLPAVTPAGEHYTPQWSPDEAGIIALVFGNGIEILRSSTADAA